MASVFRYATRVTQAVLRAAESPAARTAGCAARPRSAVAVDGRNTIARRYFSQHRRFSTAGKGKPTEVVEATEATEVGASGARPTDAAAAAGAGAGATGETGNFFFDNPGLFAALFIGSVIGYFYYNKRGADLRTSIIASIDEEAAVSPREIRQLRDDNNITTDKFDKLTKAALAEFPDGPIPYDEFNRLVVEHLFDNASQLVHWGHHLERVLKFLQIHRDPENAGLDARVSLVAISLGLKAKAKDRVPALFNVYSQDGETISRQDFVACVAALRDTFQLPSEFQVIQTEKYPFPIWKRMSAEEMVDNAVASVEAKDAPSIQGDTLNQDAFRQLLLSKALCTWGECFDKKRKKKKKKQKKAPEDPIIVEAAERRKLAEAALDDRMVFVPSTRFAGRRPGYVFQMGPQGLGYYPDALDALQARESGELPPLPAQTEAASEV